MEPSSDLIGKIVASLVVLWLSFWAFYETWKQIVRSRLYKTLKFRMVFGVWPEGNPRLRGLLEKQDVDTELGNLARDLDICYQNQEELHRTIKIGEILYDEAKKRLSQSDRTVAKAKARFNRARDIARDCGFNAHDLYSEYLAEPWRHPFPISG